MRRVIALVLLFIAALTAAQEIEVPVETQVPILLKVLGFDRKLADGSSDPLRFGVLYQPRVRSSRAVFDAFHEAAGKSGIRQVGNRELRFVAIEIEDETDLARQLGSNPVDVLYVAPLRAVRISAVTDITRQRHITSLTGVPEYVKAGVTVGLVVRGQRPEILVNRVSQKAERAEFSAQLLKMARIVE